MEAAPIQKRLLEPFIAEPTVRTQVEVAFGPVRTVEFACLAFRKVRSWNKRLLEPFLAEATVRTHSAGPKATTQRGLHLVLRRPTALAWLLYPRLRTQRPPAVTALGRPGALKVESPRGTDYVFRSAQPATKRFAK